MKHLSTVITVAALAAGLAGTAQAQDRPSRRGGMPGMLREGSPQIGETIPNISIFTDAGDPIQIHRLEGKFKVIVFGCLT